MKETREGPPLFSLHHAHVRLASHARVSVGGNAESTTIKATTPIASKGTDSPAPISSHFFPRNFYATKCVEFFNRPRGEEFHSNLKKE
jgi:hypothetical protein